MVNENISKEMNDVKILSSQSLFFLQKNLFLINLHLLVVFLILILFFPFQNMQSRTRKNIRYQNDSEAVIKQLENDFQVFQFLKENQLETINIQEYARLYNCLISEQQDRKGTYNRLMAEYQHLKQKQSDSDQQLIQKRMSMFEAIQQKTGKEIEISNDLQKQIVEAKKSLNLLKGDIGHLIGRNESAKILSSKVSKVKIVAQDQLKRVTLAFIKDRQEIKLRNKMQKRFSKKLKNVSTYQSSSLSRLKKGYAQNELKKQDIFEKLMISQKMSQNVEQTEILKQLKQEKDYQNKQNIDILINLAKVTRQFTISKLAFLNISPNDLVNQIGVYYLPLPSENNEMDKQMDEAVCQILSQYNKIQESIKAQSQFYQQLLIVKKENKEKLVYFQNQQRQLARKFNIQLEYSYKIDRQSEYNFHAKLKLFGQVLSTLFVLLSFMEKNITFNNSYPLKHSFFSYQGDDQIKNERKSIIQTKQPICYNYISCLHHVNQIISSSIVYERFYFCQAKHQQQINDFYGSMLEDVKQWFQSIKKRFTEKYLQGVLQSKNNRSSVTRHSIFGNSRRTTHLKKESNSFHQDQQEIQDDQRQDMNYFADKQNDNIRCPKSQSLMCMPHSFSESIKAKRIKLLQGIDTDYYKMIKSTIKMEKENTRKNYQFLRTFKRTKYASRDKILEQKRFQSSFSVLFTKQSAHNLAKTSKFDYNSTAESKFGENMIRNRSFFKRSTNHFNLTGNFSSYMPGRGSLNKTSQEGFISRSRIAQKMRLAMQNK